MQSFWTSLFVTFKDILLLVFWTVIVFCVGVYEGAKISERNTNKGENSNEPEE